MNQAQHHPPIVSIRELQLDDVSHLAEMSERGLRGPHPSGRFYQPGNVVQEGIRKGYNQPDLEQFSVLAACALVGYIELNHVRQDGATIRYFIGPQYTQRGFGSMAVQELADYAFRASRLGCLEAHVPVANVASRRVLGHAGFRAVDKIRASSLTYGLSRTDWLLAHTKAGQSGQTTFNILSKGDSSI